MRALKIIGAAFVLGALCAAMLFVADARRTVREVLWRPGERSTFVDPLYPPGRFDGARGGEQVMREEPGYSDIRILRGYRALTVRVAFENPDRIPVQVGMQTKDGLRFGERFLIEDLIQAKGRAQLLISAPKLREGAAPLTVKSIQVIYEQ